MNNENYVELDVSKLGERELRELRDLLDAYLGENNGTKLFGNLDKIGFNLSSGETYLEDEDLKVAMLNKSEVLEDLITCFACGDEELLSDLLESEDDYFTECCRKNLIELGLMPENSEEEKEEENA